LVTIVILLLIAGILLALAWEICDDPRKAEAAASATTKAPSTAITTKASTRNAQF
jgi:hypothetical protein